MGKVRVTMDLDLGTGDYDLQYTNLSEPGKSMDLTRILKALKKVFLDHEYEATEDAGELRSGQARLVR